MNVTWHWTQNEEDAGIQGALIQINGTDKYFQATGATSGTDPVTVFNVLEVRSFSTNDTGFYWCQMVINESILLEPSCPTQLTAVQTNDTLCTDTGTLSPRICADVIAILQISQHLLPTPSVSTHTVVLLSSRIPETSIVLSSNKPSSGIDTILLSEQTSTVAMELGTASTPDPMQTEGANPFSSSSQCEVGGTSCSAVYGAVGAAGVVVLVGGALAGLLGCVYLIRKRTVKGKSKWIVDNLRLINKKALLTVAVASNIKQVP